MNDVTKLLDGGVEEVKDGLAGLSHDDLLKLKAAETDGKKRKGVLDALEDVLAAAVQTEPADIDPATVIDTSGAPQQIVPDVDMSHPAVDSDPRAGTTDLQNRIDFNDPNKSGREVVEEQLNKQG